MNLSVRTNGNIEVTHRQKGSKLYFLHQAIIVPTGKLGANSQQSEVKCRSFFMHQWKWLVFHDAYVLGCFPLTAFKWSQDFCCVSVNLHRALSQIQFEDHVVTQETVAYSSTSRAQLKEATRDGYLRDVLGVPVQRLQRSGWLAEVQFRPSGPLPHLGRLS